MRVLKPSLLVRAQIGDNDCSGNDEQHGWFVQTVLILVRRQNWIGQVLELSGNLWNPE